MREVDTDALLRVAPSLGIGNPATATRQVVFDDENLQQVLNVTPIVARGSGFMIEVSSSVDPGAGLTSRSSNALSDLFTLGIQAEAEDLLGVDSMNDLDAYLIRVNPQITAADAGNLAQVLQGVEYAPRTGSNGDRILVRGTTAVSSIALQAGGRLDIAAAEATRHTQGYPVLPMYLTWESLLLGAAQAGGGGSLETFFLSYLWICRKGVPLNFAV